MEGMRSVSVDRHRSLTVFVVCLLLLSVLAGCSGIGSSVQATPTPTPKPVNPFQPTALPINIPQAALSSPVVGTLPGDKVLHIRISLKIDPNLLKQAQNGNGISSSSSSSNSGLQGIAKKFGISDKDYEAIRKFFSTQHIAISLSKLHTQISLNEKVSVLSKVLHTKFVIHNYNGRQFYAPDTQQPPMVPHLLVNYIDSVSGLDNYSATPIHSILQSSALKKSTKHATMLLNESSLTGTQHAAADCQAQDNTLLPLDVAHAYGFDQLWNQGWTGQNMSINLVEIDGSYQNDIQNYLDCIQFKGHINPINVDGAPQDAEGESTLDIQMVAGLARSATINVYQTDGNTDNVWVNVNDMLQQIINDNANNAHGSTVSISLGAAEGEISTQDMQMIDDSIKQLTSVEHMTVFIASGDCGAFTDRVYGDRSVSFPASDPNAVAVGGTILQVNQNQHRANEIVWSDGTNTRTCKNNWGSGGGLSDVFQAPAWQGQAVHNQYSNGNRQLPDISAAAYGLAVYFQGQWGAVGGTSAAAPIWATALTLINQGTIAQKGKYAYSPNIFYEIAQNKAGQPYYDVTRGDNLYYHATAGWDYATGWGTPNLVDFYHSLVQLMG
jgi:kumamolisin